MKLEFFLKIYMIRYKKQTVTCPECQHQYIIQMKRYDNEIQLACPECRHKYSHYKFYY